MMGAGAQAGSVRDGVVDVVLPPELAGVSVLCGGEWEAACSLRFVLPVEFSKGSYPDRCERVNGFVFEGRGNPFWRLRKLPRDELLAHVADYLNIEDFGESTATLWGADHDELMWLTGEKDRVAWELELKEGGRRLAFRIQAAQLALFRLDLGFLVLDVRPKGDAVADWFDLQHYFRFFASRGKKIALEQSQSRMTRAPSPALRDVAWDGDGGDPAANEAALAAVETARPRTGSLYRLLPLLSLLLSSTRLQDEPAQLLEEDGSNALRSDGASAVREVFAPGEMLTYSILFLDGVSDRADPVILARCVNRFHCGQPVSPFEAEPENAPEVLRYRERQCFFLSLEGSGFLATGGLEEQARQFWTRELPNHLQGIYFLLFLLVTYQRLALTRLSAEVAERTLGPRDVDRFTDIHERVLEFTGRGLFAQVARHRHHHRFYQALQRANQIELLHQEVRDEVQALKGYTDSLVQRRVETQQRRLGYGLAFLSVLAALNLWASNWPRFGSLSRALSLLVTVVVVLGVLLCAFVGARWWRQRKSDRAGSAGQPDVAGGAVDSGADGGGQRRAEHGSPR